MTTFTTVNVLYIRTVHKYARSVSSITSSLLRKGRGRRQVLSENSEDLWLTILKTKIVKKEGIL
jgi:hypothetical protein